MKRRREKGTTLVEVLVATLVFVVALAALLSSMTAVLYLIDNAKEQVMAAADLQSMMEKMRAASYSEMNQNFPNGVVDGSNARRYWTMLGGYTLRNEHITVTYAIPNSDPLEIRTSITWLDKRGRAMSASLSTFKTR